MSFQIIDSISQTLEQDSLTEWLAVVMVIGFLMSLAALLVLRFLRRFGPALQTDVIRMHLVALMVSPVFCVLWIRPPLPIVRLGQSHNLIQESRPDDVEEPGNPEAPASVFHEFGRESDVVRGEIPETAVPVEPDLSGLVFADAGVSLRHVLIGFWLAVSVGLTIRQLVTHIRTYRWSGGLSAENSERVELIAQEVGIRGATLAVAEDIESPVTIGLFRSTVVVPGAANEWGQHELRMALLHELTHVRRRDVLWCTLLSLAACFYWPVPTAWTLRRNHWRLIELVCDDAVLKSDSLGVDYAEFLTRIALRPSRSASASGLLMAEPSLVRQRIERLLDGNVSYNKTHFTLKFLLPASIAALMLTLVAMRPSFGEAEVEATANEEIASSEPLDDGKGVARPVPEKTWDERRAAIDTASDVLVVLNATDTRSPLAFVDQESRPRILAIGTGEELTKALMLKEIDGLISLQPYGFGYRSIELLAKSRKGSDEQQRVRIPPKLVRYQEANSLSRDLSLIRSGEGPELTKQWNDGEMDRAEIRQIKVSIPSGSVWWDAFQAGAQRAAQQGNLPITFNRIQIPSWDADRDAIGPTVYMRLERGFGVVSSMKPNDWGHSEMAGSVPVEMQLVTDIDWIAYQILLFIQQSSDRPRRIWLWHADVDLAMANEICGSINRQVSSFAFREPVEIGPVLENQSK